MAPLSIFQKRSSYDWAKAESILDVARHESRPLSTDALLGSTRKHIKDNDIKGQMQADALREEDWETERRAWLGNLCALHAGKLRAAAQHFKVTNSAALNEFRAAKLRAAAKLAITPQYVQRGGWSWMQGTPTEKRERAVLVAAAIAFACLMTWTMSRMLDGTTLGKGPWAFVGIPLMAAIQIFLAKAGSSALIESSFSLLGGKGLAKLKLAFGVAVMASLAALVGSMAVLSATTTSRLSLAQGASPGKGYLLASEIACEVLACAFIVYRHWKMDRGVNVNVNNKDWDSAKAEFERWQAAEEELGRMICQAEEALDAVAKVSAIVITEQMSDFRSKITLARPKPLPVIN